MGLFFFKCKKYGAILISHELLRTHSGEPDQLVEWKTGHVCDPGLGNEDNFRLNCTCDGGGGRSSNTKGNFYGQAGEGGKKPKEKTQPPLKSTEIF